MLDLIKSKGITVNSVIVSFILHNQENIWTYLKTEMLFV